MPLFKMLTGSAGLNKSMRATSVKCKLQMGENNDCASPLHQTTDLWRLSSGHFSRVIWTWKENGRKETVWVGSPQEIIQEIQGCTQLLNMYFSKLHPTRHTHICTPHIYACSHMHAHTHVQWVTVTANDMTGTVPCALLDLHGAHKCINWGLLFFSFSWWRDRSITR